MKILPAIDIKDAKCVRLVKGDFDNKTEYQIYMQRVKQRESQGDKLRNVCKEINSLKAELKEIKDLILKGKK